MPRFGTQMGYAAAHLGHHRAAGASASHIIAVQAEREHMKVEISSKFFYYRSGRTRWHSAWQGGAAASDDAEQQGREGALLGLLMGVLRGGQLISVLHEAPHP